jgi:peptidyl-dipeptidase Dcp
MKLHLAGDTLIDPTAFERETLNKLNMPEEIVMRHRILQSDIFFQAICMLTLWADDQHGCVRAFTEGDGPGT